MGRQCFDRAAGVRTIAALRDQSLQPELARLAKQVRADLALFEIAVATSPVAEPKTLACNNKYG